MFTFLGITDYLECVYTDEKLGWHSSCTRYVQIAITEMLIHMGKPPDQVIVLLTEQARRLNWEDHNDKNGNRIMGLKSAWSSLTTDQLPELKTIHISARQDEEAMWELFNIMFDEINDVDEVFLDISNCFRSIPVVSLIVSNFTRVMKRANLQGMYYGNLDSIGTRKEIEQLSPTERKVPIEDLAEMIALYEWTQAVDDYIRTGNAGLLVQMAEKRSTSRAEDTMLVELAVQMKRVSMSIETCRGQLIDSEISKMLNQLHKIQKLASSSSRMQPLLKMLDKIEQKFKGFHQGDSITNLTFIVNWCIQHHLYQQGYTILQEGTISILAEYCQLDVHKYENREDIKKSINIVIKKHTKFHILSEKQKTLYRKIYPLASMLQFFPSLTKYRNNINHYQMIEDELNHEQVAIKLQELLKDASRLLYRLRTMNIERR